MTPVNYIRGAIDPFACINDACELVKRRLGLYVVAGIVTVVLIGFVPYAGIILSGPLTGGFAHLVLKDMRGLPVRFGMLFKGFEKFLPLMLMGIIDAVPTIVFEGIELASTFRVTGGPGTVDPNFFQFPSEFGEWSAGLTAAYMMFTIGYAVFAIIWSLALTFALPLIIEHDVGIGDAIKLSLGAVFGNIGRLVVLVLLGALVALVGLMAFCVGIFLAIPVIYVSQVFAYRQVFPAPDNFTSPVAYGSSFSGGI